jgi:hypothetical protein
VDLQCSRRQGTAREKQEGCHNTHSMHVFGHSVCIEGVQYIWQYAYAAMEPRRSLHLYQPVYVSCHACTARLPANHSSNQSQHPAGSCGGCLCWWQTETLLTQPTATMSGHVDKMLFCTNSPPSAAGMSPQHWVFRCHAQRQQHNRSAASSSCMGGLAAAD